MIITGFLSSAAHILESNAVPGWHGGHGVGPRDHLHLGLGQPLELRERALLPEGLEPVWERCVRFRKHGRQTQQWVGSPRWLCAEGRVGVDIRDDVTWDGLDCARHHLH